MTQPILIKVATGCGVLLTLGLVLATPAMAEQVPTTTVTAESEDVMVAYVPYGDLNLALPSDQKALDGRVLSAARRVCDFNDGSIVNFRERICRRDAYRRAKPQMVAAIDRAKDRALALAPRAPIIVH